MVEGDNISKGNSVQLLLQFFVSSPVFFSIQSSSPLWQLSQGWKINFGGSEQLGRHSWAGTQGKKQLRDSRVGGLGCTEPQLFLLEGEMQGLEVYG